MTSNCLFNGYNNLISAALLFLNNKKHTISGKHKYRNINTITSTYLGILKQIYP